MFAQVSTQQVIEGFGLPAAIVIIVLAAAVLFLYLRNEKIQKERLDDLKDTQNSLTGPLDEITTQNKKIYELLVDMLSKRGK